MTPEVYVRTSFNATLGSKALFRVITLPEDVRNFYSDSDAHFKAASGNGGWLFHQLLGSCLGLVNGLRWRNLRREFEPSFTYSVIAKRKGALREMASAFIKDLGCTTAGERVMVHVSNTFMAFPFFCTAEILYGPMTSAEKAELWNLGELRLPLMRYILKGGIYRTWFMRWICPGVTSQLGSYRSHWLAFNERMASTRKHFSSEMKVVKTWLEVQSDTVSQAEVMPISFSYHRKFLLHLQYAKTRAGTTNS